MAWNIVNASYPQVLRGILQQTLEGLPYVAPEYTSPGAAANSPVERMVGLAIRRFELHNLSGGAANVGVGFRWANRYWIAGQHVSATNTFTDDTTDAQDLPAATADFPLMTTTAGDGFIIASPRKFSWVSLRIETADVGASADVTARYSNFAGTGWTAAGADASYAVAATNGIVKAAGTNYTDATERVFVWIPPNDWGKSVGLATGLPDGLYALSFQTDVATTAAEASVIEVGSMVAVKALADNGIYENESSSFYDPYGDALVAFFSVTGVDNRVYAEVTTV